MYKEELLGKIRDIFVLGGKRQLMNFRRATLVRSKWIIHYIYLNFYDIFIFSFYISLGDDWTDVTLDEFADCESNLGTYVKLHICTAIKS